MEYKEITKEQRELLNKALPNESCKKHPTKSFLTSINPIYVIERLNDVFGVGVWQTRTELIENKNSMVVVKVTLNIPTYNIHIEQFGGNDNGGEDKKGFDIGLKKLELYLNNLEAYKMVSLKKTGRFFIYKAMV